MHHLISGINSLIHFVSHVLIYLFLTRHTSMIISPRQRHYHHSCHSSPHHSFIPISKLFFFSNPILRRHLAPPRTDSTAIHTCSRFLFLLFFSFFLSFSFHYYSSFLTFSVFLSYFSFLYFSHFSNFVSFTFNSISILSISHFIFLFTRESSYCFERILAIAILSVRPSVRHMGGSVKNGVS